ncbi:ATP-binding protein [Streptomyces sp. NPDC023588]|uniref:ATP-binding protein n=1 Tax=Streptomyces sp. NPDC023588 TaxID=3154907 RepID=UPI0034094E5A
MLGCETCPSFRAVRVQACGGFSQRGRVWRSRALLDPASRVMSATRLRRRRSPRMSMARCLTARTWSMTVMQRRAFGADILDRLLHHCDAISVNGPSNRPKNRLAAIERDAYKAPSRQWRPP